jgi:hypothetical protein
MVHLVEGLVGVVDVSLLNNPKVRRPFVQVESGAALTRRRGRQR